ncbi:unnamed protein product, partial [Prorocentrum cordatum]
AAPGRRPGRRQLLRAHVLGGKQQHGGLGEGRQHGRQREHRRAPLELRPLLARAASATATPISQRMCVGSRPLARDRRDKS